MTNREIESQIEGATDRNQSSHSGAQPAKMRTGASLSSLGAVGRALWNVEIDFYPRLGTDKIKSVSSDEIILEMAKAMKAWETIPPSHKDLDKAIELAKASLNEAKQQTEYQDQKATRLLTVTTFLTALAGAFFTAFGSDYPLRTIGSASGPSFFFLVATYLAFVMFVLCALTGALVTFHGTRTRFKYPAEATVSRQVGPTRSFLFFREIIGVSPTGWANSFVDVTEERGRIECTLRPDLKVQYLKNYVGEAYLVSAKTADKLRYLEPAQNLLAWALRLLLLYIILLVGVTANIKPTKPPIEPYLIRFAPLTPPPFEAGLGANRDVSTTAGRSRHEQ